MIGGLQGDFGDLDIKYLKKNISKCRLHISGSFKRTPRHCAKWLRNSRGKRYQRIRICLTREVETPSFPIRRLALDVKHLEMVERHPNKIPDVGYPKKMERRKGDCPHVHGVGIHPEKLHSDSPRGYMQRAPLSGLPQEEAPDTRDHHTRTIAYPIRMGEEGVSTSPVRHIRIL